MHANRVQNLSIVEVLVRHSKSTSDILKVPLRYFHARANMLLNGSMYQLVKSCFQ